MTLKAQVILNYGFMLNDINAFIGDYTYIISKLVKQNNLQNDKDLLIVGNAFGAVTLSLKNLDEILKIMSEENF